MLVESIVEPRNGSSLAKFMDLSMLVMTGGRERTEPEYQALLARAGLKITNVDLHGYRAELERGTARMKAEITSSNSPGCVAEFCHRD